MIEKQERNKKLSKEVLRRANRDEKQAYNTLNNRRLAIFDSFSEANRAFSSINDTKNMDLCPKDPTLSDKLVTEMSNAEFSDYIRRWNKYSVEYFEWSNRQLS